MRNTILRPLLGIFLLLCGTAGLTAEDKEKNVLKEKNNAPTAVRIQALQKIVLTSAEKKYRLQALDLLDRMRSVHTLEALSAIVRETKTDEIRERAALALTRLPQYKGYRFLEYGTSLTSSPKPVRLACLKALTATLGPKITHLVNLLLRDNDPEIQLAAAQVLPRTVTDYNVYQMIELLQGKSLELKRAVAAGMEALNSPRTVPAAIAAIGRETDKELLLTLLAHLVKAAPAEAKRRCAAWAKDSAKPSAFRKQCRKTAG